jgi:hypothetical protein
MVEVKQNLIKREGVNCSIYDINSVYGSINADISSLTSNVNTICLVGKLKSLTGSALSLEVYRKGIFLPDVNIKSGNIVKNNITNEYYIVVGISNEIIYNELCSVNSLMMKCNSIIDINDEVETADDNGNISKNIVTEVSNLSVYTHSDTLNLKQYDPGQYPQCKFNIYMPSLPVSLNNKIILKTVNPPINLKIVGIDSITYEGLLVVTVITNI